MNIVKIIAVVLILIFESVASKSNQLYGETVTINSIQIQSTADDSPFEVCVVNVSYWEGQKNIGFALSNAGAKYMLKMFENAMLQSKQMIIYTNKHTTIAARELAGVGGGYYNTVNVIMVQGVEYD